MTTTKSPTVIGLLSCFSKLVLAAMPVVAAEFCFSTVNIVTASDNVAARTVHKNATVCKKRLLRRRAPSSEAFSSLVFPLCGFCLLRPPYTFQRAVKFLFRNRLHQPVRRLFGVCYGDFLFGYSVYHAHAPHVLVVEGQGVVQKAGILFQFLGFWLYCIKGISPSRCSR